MNRTALLLVAAAVIVTMTGCPKQDEVTNVPPPPKAVSASATGSGAGTGEVSVYVPCGLTVPLVAAIDKYEEMTPGVEINGEYDTGIAHALNIKDKGERPDLLVSPGKREVGILEVAGLVDPAEKWEIGYFELVVSVPKDNPRGIESLEDLTKADVITMPDPERNSIGLYGKQALEAAGLWDELMPEGDDKKILLMDFPIDAYKPVASGKSEAAIMFENCPMKTEPEKLEEGSVRVAAKIDKALYEKPICYIALLKDAPNPDAARAFAEFLAATEGQAVLAEHSVKTLDDAAGKVGRPQSAATATATTGDGPIVVEAFYPDNEGHAYIKEIVAEINKRYAGKAKATFYAFGEDVTQKKMLEYDLMCGTICVNGEKTVNVEVGGQEHEVSFMMGEGGEWTRDDLYAYLDQLTAE